MIGGSKMKTAYRYDKDGMWMPGEEIYVFPNYLDEYELPEGGYTFEEIPQPNWKPKFDGVKWVETITEDELDDMNPPKEQPVDPAEIDLLKEKNVELENALLELTEISSAQETKVAELESSLLELSLYTSTQEERNNELEKALMEMTVVAAKNEVRTTENEEALLETTMLVGGMTDV